MTKKCAIGFIAFISMFDLARAEPAPGRNEAITCKQATLTKPVLGVAYQGFLSNEDYGLTGKIPQGLTGWSGVAAGAPFHGFTIFLDDQMSSCIIFEIHIRVNDVDAPPVLKSAKRFRLGDAEARQSASRGRGTNGLLTNVSTTFSIARPDAMEDGVIRLVASGRDLGHATALYDDFVRTVKLSKTGTTWTAHHFRRPS